MEKGEMTRRDVETKLASVGDYVKMDYLQACLKKQLDFDTRKFVLTTLSGIYESKKMFLDAGKLLRASAEINVTFDAKMVDYMKSAELLINAGAFDESDISFTKALACGTDLQKANLKTRRKEIYKKQAQEYIQRDKRKHAMEAYEKLLELDLQGDEKKVVQSTLLGLYEKLGKVKEYGNLKRSMSGNQINAL